MYSSFIKMGEEHARTNYAFLKFLADTDRRQRESVLGVLSAAQVRFLAESVINLFFNSDIKIEPGRKKYLNKHITVLKELASKRVSVAEKRDLCSAHERVVQVIAKITSEYLEKSL